MAVAFKDNWDGDGPKNDGEKQACAGQEKSAEGKITTGLDMLVLNLDQTDDGDDQSGRCQKNG